jgi:histidine kinase
LDENELSVGAILLMHDLTDQIALATERHRRERLDLLTQIIGTIAHGVRTPLTAVRTYVELASGSVQDPELEAFRRDTVSPQLERLNDLINQMVHMVQQPEPNFELVRPELLVEHALRQVFASEPEAQRPRLEVEGSLPRIIADPGPTQEAIVYLTRYLRDSQDSPLHLWLAAEGTAEEACVSLRISSLQPPRREIELEEIFDPVSALQASSTDLGPVISRRILENQGGKVEARLYEGNLEFRVLFPVPFLGSTTLRESSYMPPA